MSFSCVAKIAREGAAMAVTEWLLLRPRMTHVYGRGLIDPWSRDDKTMLDS